MTTNKHTAGRFLQCLAVGGPGSGGAAYGESQNWADRAVVVQAVRAAVAVTDTNTYPASLQPIADAFVAGMRPYSVPLRLMDKLRRVPLLTRIFVNASTGRAIEVTEGQPLPVLRGDWTASTLEARKFGAISVVTLELVRSTSPVAAAGISDDLAQATAAADNYSFLNPQAVGSVLYGRPNFLATGSTAAAIATDLQTLFSVVAGHGGGALALLMHEATAGYIHFSDPAKFPQIGPAGGMLAGVPVLITDAAELVGSPRERIIGLIDASSIVWADRGRVELTTTREAALQMSDAPAATAANVVSMFQSDSVATKALRESAWYARPGAGAYLVVPY